jgi:hypothetical protein
MKALVLVATALIFICGGGAWALSGSDLAGNWTVTWPNNTKNAISLSFSEERFSGTYTNDARQSCTLTGNFSAASGSLSFHVACPSWEMRMEGQASPDGRTIQGDYKAYANATGSFTMARQ